MPKYRVDTDHGSYMVETEDAPALPPLPPASMPIPGGLAGPPTKPRSFVQNALLQPFDMALSTAAIGKGTIDNTREFLTASGHMLASNPEAGGSPVSRGLDGSIQRTPPPTPQQVDRFGQALDRPIVPISKGFAPGTFAHGAASAAESLTSPTNAGLVLATAATGGAAGATGEVLNHALSLYFTAQMAQGFTRSTAEAYNAFQHGDYDAVAEHLGQGTVEGLMTALGVKHAVDNTRALAPAEKDGVADNGGRGGGNNRGESKFDAIRPGFKVQLDPAEASAVAYGHEQGVQMPTSVLTGSPVAAASEKILQHFPLASGVAKAARATEQSTLAAAGAREVTSLGAQPGSDAPVPQPLDVGEAIHQTAIANEQAHGARANDSYDLLRSIENQPQHTARLQTGTKQVDAGLDEQGNPAYKTVPVFEDVQLPVDYRGLKAAVRPLLAETLRPMSIAQEQSSTGIKAMRNILDAPDFVPASAADQDLGALKGIMRDSPQSRSVGQAKFAADLLSKQVDQAVARAGPDATAALQQGRAATVDKYRAQDFQKSIGFKDVGTGNASPGSAVDLVKSLTRDGDRSITLLRSLQDHAPEHIPALAQTVVQGLLDKVTAEAGMGKAQTALTGWQKLGDQTKSILFRQPAKVQALTDFFTLAKKMNENPNPSGSGTMLAMVKGIGLVLTQPHIGVPVMLGSKPLARLLFTPNGSRLLMKGMTTPVESGAFGARLGSDIVKAAGPGGAVPVSSVPATAEGLSTNSAIDAQAQTGGNYGQQRTGTAGQVEPLPGAVGTVATDGNRAASGGQRSPTTTVTVAGQPGPGYPARYKFQERVNVQGSHNGNTFAPNPKYELVNDRRYDDPVNQGKLVNYSSRQQFNPRNSINNNPDATSGPMVVDTNQRVLSGNGQKAILDRVYSGNPEGVVAYRALLEKEAHLYGLDATEARGMKEPVLTREIDSAALPDVAAKQKAITDFNKTTTAALTPSERAIADARRVSTGTLDHIAARLDEHGANATLADVLQGKPGGEVLNKLIDDGVVSSGERGALMQSDGQLTDAGKDRISNLVLGRFFHDSSQLKTIAPTIRNQVERIAAPLAQVEGKPGWSLTPHVQDALSILEQAQKLGIKSVDKFLQQDGLFGKDKYAPEAVTLARALQTMSAKEIKLAARQYAQDAAYASKGANTLMGDAPTPESSFDDAFGAAKAPANALAPPKK